MREINFTNPFLRYICWINPSQITHMRWQIARFIVLKYYWFLLQRGRHPFISSNKQSLAIKILFMCYIKKFAQFNLYYVSACNSCPHNIIFRTTTHNGLNTKMPLKKYRKRENITWIKIFGIFQKMYALFFLLLFLFNIKFIAKSLYL